MPTPFTVDSPATGLAVWSVDSNGTTIQTGTVVSGDGVTLPITSSPTVPAPGQVKLYNSDGHTLQVLAPDNVPVNLTLSGTLTQSGTTTQTGVTNITAGAAATDVITTQVTGDTNPRWEIQADGKQWWGPGNGAVDANFYRASAGKVTTDGSMSIGGDLDIYNTGRGLQVAEGSNAKMGTAVLTAGSKVVANTAVTASSRIYLTSQVDGGTPGFLRVSTRTAGTSFTITSSSGTDTSTVAYLLVEPG